MLTFAERLHHRIRELDSRVCLGIDPRPTAHPLTHPESHHHDPAQIAKAVVSYYRDIIEATSDLVACYKPQSAFFEVLGIPGMIALAQLIADLRDREIPVILDAKRGDIGSTAEAYAQAYLADGVMGVDALTVNPFLGSDGLQPFITQAQRAGRGIFVLVKTSNPGSHDLQDVDTLDGGRVFELLADQLTLLAEPYVDDMDYSPIGVVVGATHPEVMAGMRASLPHSIFLVPGYGTQGGTAEDVVNAFDDQGLGAVISASRSLSYITQEEDYAEAAREATAQMRDDINGALNTASYQF